MSIELKPCPFCNFTPKKYAEHVIAARHYATEYDTYTPVLFKDRITNKWAVECQTCGTVFLLYADCEADAATRWNTRQDEGKATT